MKRERKLSIGCSLMALLALAVASCNNKKNAPTPPPPVRVAVITVGEGEASAGREYSGTVVSAQTTLLSFSVGGTVTSLAAKEGQKVTKGQLLGRLESGDYENARNIAYAQLAEAQDGYERLKKLHDANALPAVKWVEMEQKLKQAQNAAEMADRTLHDAALYSPASGVISRKFVEPGQTVIPAQPIYEIVSTAELEVEVPVTEKEIASYHSGDKAKISFESKELQPVEGIVTSKAVVADPLTRAYTMKLSLPSGHEGILPGMIANVVFESASEKQEETSGIILPLGTVLLNHDNRWFVWIVKNGEAQRRFVEADELVADGIMVTRGLERGDTVIVEGMQKVGTGSVVIPVDN